MFTIYGGKAAFDQWDKGQRVENPEMAAGDKVIFLNGCGETHPMKAYTYEDSVVCDVPNDLLRMARPILVDLCGSREHTTRLMVTAREKPDDYVYEDNTQSDGVDYEEIERRLDDLAEEVDELDRYIPLLKQGSQVSCILTFAQVAEFTSKKVNRVVATLAITSADTSTTTLELTTYYAFCINCGLSLVTQEVVWVQVSFMLSDGSIAKYQFNPDNTITELTT